MAQGPRRFFARISREQSGWWGDRDPLALIPVRYVLAVNARRLLARIIRGDLANVSFDDLIQLVEEFGFREIGGRGSHRVFFRGGMWRSW